MKIGYYASNTDSSSILSKPEQKKLPISLKHRWDKRNLKAILPSLKYKTNKNDWVMATNFLSIKSNLCCKLFCKLCY